MPLRLQAKVLCGACFLAGAAAVLLFTLSAPVALLGAGTVLLVATFCARRCAASIALFVKGNEPALIERIRRCAMERDDALRLVNELKQARQQLEYRAAHDALTGLANRRQFDEALREAVARCEHSAERLTVLYIDVDGFKKINDVHGHAAGDEVLRHFASRLRAAIRHNDMAARLGGDEFAVVLRGATPARAASTAKNLVERLSKPYAIGATTLEVSASVGVAQYPESASTAQELLEAADAAMYKAKIAGKRQFALSGLQLPDSIASLESRDVCSEPHASQKRHPQSGQVNAA